MSIVRAPRRQRYTQVDNRALEDDRVSFKAKGLLVYILSKPDHWRTNREQLASAGPDGVDAVRSALRELAAAGYIERRQHRAQGGRFEWEAVVHEVPTTGGFSTDGLSTGGKPTALVKTEAAKTEQPSGGAPAAQAALDGMPPAAPADPDAAAWQLVRDCEAARDRKPVAFRHATVAGVVRQLLNNGVDPARVRQALMGAPAWTPSSLQVELDRGRANGNGRTPGQDPGERLRGRTTLATFDA